MAKRSKRRGGTETVREHLASLLRRARGGDAVACSALGAYYQDGYRDGRGKLVVKRSLATARRWFLAAWELGEASGLTAVAGIVSDHEGRVAEATRMYRRAFAAGDTIAAYNLACTYQNQGRWRAAVQWYRKARDAGEPSALVPLAYAELYGLGMRQNIAAAFAKLREVAQWRGPAMPQWLRAEAMMAIGWARIEGWPLLRDFRDGVGWLRRAARLGNGCAIAMLRDGYDVANRTPSPPRLPRRARARP